jgi:hypothetical protein
LSKSRIEPGIKILQERKNLDTNSNISLLPLIGGSIEILGMKDVEFEA